MYKRIQKEMSWSEIAVEFYQIESHKELKSVVEALRKQNSELPQEGTAVLLPEVKDIPFQDLDNRKRRWLLSSYTLYWLIPPLLWIFVHLWNVITGNNEFSTDLLAIWTILFVVVLFFIGPPGRSNLRTLFRYTLIWLLVPIVLIAWVRPLLENLFPQAYLTLTSLNLFSNLFDEISLVLIWTTMVFLIFVWLGNESTEYRTYFGQYADIWTFFALTVLVILLVINSAYTDVVDRVSGLRSSETLALHIVDDLHRNTETLYSRFIVFKNNVSEVYESNELEPKTESEGSINTVGQERYNKLEKDIANIEKEILSVKLSVTDAITYLNKAIQEQNLIINNLQAHEPEDVQDILDMEIRRRDILSNTLEVTSQTMPLADELSDNVEKVHIEFSNVVSNNATLLDLERVIDSELVVPASRMRLVTQSVFSTMGSIQNSVFATFYWIATAFAIFALFPWLLLFLFLFRKRNDRTHQIRDNLLLLAPGKSLLKRVVGDMVEPVSENERGYSADKRLAEQAFNNIEYTIGLLLLSMLTVIGWYYVFYPDTNFGLALLIHEGGDITRVTRYLSESSSPLTFGFIGAYFFILQLLYRRYRDADLYPSAFLQASERLLRVFILSLVLSVLSPLVQVMFPDLTAVDVYLSGIAFVFGILPRYGLRYIYSLLRVDKFIPLPHDSARLTKLDGINLFHESRLLDEGVENIQNLAEVQIERLILRTYYSANQIVDWIDQAILYKHCGNDGQWFPLFREVGIRTATDLLDRCGLRLLHIEDLNHLRTDNIATYQADEPTSDLLDSIVKSMHDAREISGNSEARGSTVMTSEIVKTIYDCIWPDNNMSYILNYYFKTGKRLVSAKESGEPE